MTTSAEPETSGAPYTGLVLASHGANARIEADSIVYSCIVRRKAGGVACGDRVAWTPSGDGTAVIDDVAPRRNVLSRLVESNKIKILAANIDQLLVTVEAPLDIAEPPLESFDTLNLDRYIVAAEVAKITPTILINKIDRLDADQQNQVRLQLDLYRSMGYSIVLASTRRGDGLEDVRRLLTDKISVVVGQSGVGKSSLINALIPGMDVTTGELSRVTGQGRHTTTVATLHHLACGGDLIDSPGVREFQLTLTNPHEIAWGFREFRPLLGQCRFNDCKHRDEPGCAIRDAVAAGAIHPRRLAHYLSIVQGTAQPHDWQRAKSDADRRRDRQRD